MKFKYTGDGQDVRVYGGHVVNKGDVIELDAHFSEKALANPECGLEEVKDTAKVTSLSAEEQAAADKAVADKEAAKHEKKGGGR